MFGDLRADVFSAKKNPFLKHNNSSNRSKTKTAIIANSWNYHICEAPRTTASFPSGSKKNSVTQCWRIWSFSHNAEIFQRIYGSWQADVWDSGTRLVRCVDSYTLCLQSAIITLCVWLLAIDFFPAMMLGSWRWLVVELCRFFAACVPIYY